MRNSRLSLDDPKALLNELACSGNAAAVHSEVSFRMPHFTVLGNFLAESDPQESQLWAACLARLTELQAPIDSGVLSGFSLYARSAWTPKPELVAQVFSAHVRAGLIDVTRPLPGTLQYETYEHTADELFAMKGGMSPVAVAILMDHQPLVAALLANGASFDVGPVTLGGPRIEAFEYASTCNASAALAALSAHVMRRQLDLSLNARAEGGLVAAPSPMPSRRLATV